MISTMRDHSVKANLTSGNHWLELVLVLTVQGWLAPIIVGGAIIVGEDKQLKFKPRKLPIILHEIYRIRSKLIKKYMKDVIM